MLNKQLTGPQALFAFLAIICAMAMTSAIFRDAPPAAPEAPTARDIAREQYKAQRRAERRVQARMVEESVDRYCARVGRRTEACRDMRMAAGLAY